jgi:hypothetical protein
LITDSIQELSDLIIKEIEDSGVKIISIDGWTGSGKSFLMDSLEIEATKISVDDYYKKHSDQYVDVIYYDDLKDKVLESKGLIMLEGICIQEVLNRIVIIPDLTIYIKRLSNGGFWSEEEYVNKENAEEIFYLDDKNLEYDIITGEKREISDDEKELTEKRQGVFYDLVRYHYKYLPHLNSDIVFERKV